MSKLIKKYNHWNEVLEDLAQVDVLKSEFGLTDLSESWQDFIPRLISKSIQQGLRGGKPCTLHVSFHQRDLYQDTWYEDRDKFYLIEFDDSDSIIFQLWINMDENDEPSFIVKFLCPMIMGNREYPIQVRKLKQIGYKEVLDNELIIGYDSVQQ